MVAAGGHVSACYAFRQRRHDALLVGSEAGGWCRKGSVPACESCASCCGSHIDELGQLTSFAAAWCQHCPHLFFNSDRPGGIPVLCVRLLRHISTESILFFESRILTCLTYTSRRGSQHRGQTAEQEDTKARKAKLQRPRTAAQGSRSHKHSRFNPRFKC